MKQSLRQPNVWPIRNADFGFGIWPWSKGPLYQLRDPYWRFHVLMPDGSLRHFEIPFGYVFNGASVPSMLWGFPFGYTPDGVYRAKALEHDFLCDLGKRSQDFLWMMKVELGVDVIPDPVPFQVAHNHFANGLNEYGMRKSQACAFGKVVQLFGPRWKTV